MTSISVLFEVPVEIAKGLADGSLERVGGVIRRIGDKQIVVWLTETGEDLAKGEKIPSILTSPQMLMGMQVANLAVNVAGFALIYHKLQQVERQLNGIDQKLVNLSHDQGWLDKKQLFSHLAPVVSSMNTLEGIYRINDKSIARDKLISADNKLDEASVYFRQILGDMLIDKLEQERPDEFAACYRAWLMASQGRIQTMAELGEIPEAYARADAFKLEHQTFGRDFLEIRRDPLRKLANERAKSHAEQLLAQLGQQCAGAHEIIKGKVLQLKFMKENGLEVMDLPVLEAQKNKGYALLHFN
ncbi:hypothetical protein HBJ58_16940 [Halomonas desiderata]|uniref:hypothetical protein n=1 Tax=Billgrantia desiderata TaxID=52021 RepID=UPI001748422A|nr:hypothetical protein [Halomonas desiderata]